VAIESMAGMMVELKMWVMPQVEYYGWMLQPLGKE
jgi:hypothetical protein